MDIKRYESLLSVLDEYSDILERDSSLDVRHGVAGRIELLRVSEDFGIDFSWVSHYEATNFKLNEYTRVMLWNDRCKISWSDDNIQPEVGEYLYIISFPTGAYIFGQHYPEQLFREFFNELVVYKPKYLDTPNKTLYFSSENAKYIHEAFPDILKKYGDRVSEDYKRIRKEELLKELDELGE